MPDHVHLVCSVPPRLAVAEVLDKVKGASAHYINHLPDREHTLYWQAGYGVLTFARKDLARIVKYVENQKRHHEENALWPSLEKLAEEGSSGSSDRPLRRRSSG
jgi:REP element-mobilizing transposase RayT